MGAGLRRRKDLGHARECVSSQLCGGPNLRAGANPLILPMLAVRWIAIRNLIISVPNLLLSFATWLVWSMIVAKIQKLHDKDPTVYDFGEHGRLQPAVLAGLRLHPMACCS